MLVGTEELVATSGQWVCFPFTAIVEEELGLGSGVSVALAALANKGEDVARLVFVLWGLFVLVVFFGLDNGQVGRT